MDLSIYLQITNLDKENRIVEGKWEAELHNGVGGFYDLISEDLIRTAILSDCADLMKSLEIDDLELKGLELFNSRNMYAIDEDKHGTFLCKIESLY